jgi:hypothetical protein
MFFKEENIFENKEHSFLHCQLFIMYSGRRLMGSRIIGSIG